MFNMSKMEIGSLLKSLRISNRLTLEQAATLAGINSSHLSEIERGKKVPKFNMVERIIHSHGSLMRLSIEDGTFKISSSSEGE